MDRERETYSERGQTRKKTKKIATHSKRERVIYVLRGRHKGNKNV